jgi:hypothetical protein
MGSDGDRASPRFERGCRCFAIERNGEILSYGWLSAGREWIGELGLWISPEPGEAYVWNCFTLEPHRRRGHYRSLLHGFVSITGVRRLWIGSLDIPAEKADADAGFIRVLGFESSPRGDSRLLEVRAVEGADRSLVDEARRRLGLTGWSHTARVESRRH